MKNKKTEANISMVVSKTFSGLNMNALKYLLPLWMSPLTGASFRCVFAAVAFWVIGWFMKPEVSTTKDKVWLFLLGAIGIYGFMFLYLVGLSKTTPVSSSIFTSLQPIWVFLIMVFFYKEKATWMKILGILIGLPGIGLGCLERQEIFAGRNGIQRKLSWSEYHSGRFELLSSCRTNPRTILSIYSSRIRGLQTNPI